MDVQAAFEYFRKESALVGDELRRLLVPKMDGPRSEEEPLQRQQELKALLKRQDEAACLLLTLKGRETPRPLAEEIAEQGGDALGVAAVNRDEELVSPEQSSDLFVATIIERPNFPLPVVVHEQLITIENSSPGQEMKTFQEKDVTVTVRSEETDEGAPTVAVGDDPSIAPEIPRPRLERGLQKQRLDYDWSSLAARCTAAKLPASHLLKDLSEAFDARFGISELGLSTEEAFSFMEHAFPKLNYEFRFKDPGWVVTLSNHECRNRDALALAIYGAACVMLESQRTDIPDQTEKNI